MRIETLSCHMFDDNHIPFDVGEYSRFKHGSLPAARSMGRELAIKFIKSSRLGAILSLGKQIIVFPSAYRHIPSACSEIQKEFLNTLNCYLADKGLPTALSGKVHRDLTYFKDYGKLETGDRQRFLSGDFFYLDEKYIQDKFCIFMDDVKITGSHETMVETLISSFVSRVDYMHCYYANYNGKNSTIEDYLNTNCIDCILDMDELIYNNQFFFNARNIKLMMRSDEETFKKFVQDPGKTVYFLRELYCLSVGNRYHTVEEFKPNLLILKNLLDSDATVKYGEVGAEEELSA